MGQTIACVCGRHHCAGPGAQGLARRPWAGAAAGFTKLAVGGARRSRRGTPIAGGRRHGASGWRLRRAGPGGRTGRRPARPLVPRRRAAARMLDGRREVACQEARPACRGAALEVPHHAEARDKEAPACRAGWAASEVGSQAAPAMRAEGAGGQGSGALAPVNALVAGDRRGPVRGRRLVCTWVKVAGLGEGPLQGHGHPRCSTAKVEAEKGTPLRRARDDEVGPRFPMGRACPRACRPGRRACAPSRRG